jgi:hypothetical protein
MAHLLWCRIAAAVAIEACHRPERTNFERLAENVPANPPTTSTSVVIPQHRPVQIELLGAAEGAVGALTFTLVDGRCSALSRLEVRLSKEFPVAGCAIGSRHSPYLAS